MIPTYVTEGGHKIELPEHPPQKWQLVPWWHYKRWSLGWFILIPILRSKHIFRRQIFRWIIDHEGCYGDWVWEYGGKEV